MTKIKNTKKGMAKKTLSMSLVVAMLATSNVPVWAAEFSDGTDVNTVVTAETPVVEEFSDNAVEATATYAEGNYTADVTFNNTTVTWNSDTITATVSVKDADNKDVIYKYAWKVGTDEATATGTETTGLTYTTGEADFNKNIYLYVWVEENGTVLWEKTIKAAHVDPVNLAVSDYSFSWQDALGNWAFPNQATDDTWTREYDGKAVDKTAKLMHGTTDETADFTINYPDDLTNAGDITLKATPKDDKYIGVVEQTVRIVPKELVAAELKATLKSDKKSFAWTGNAPEFEKTDVTVVDTKTKDDISSMVKRVVHVSTSDTRVGKYQAYVEFENKEAVKNYKLGVNAVFSDEYEITARDLADCTFTIGSLEYKANGITADEVKNAITAVVAKDGTTLNVDKVKTRINVELPESGLNAANTTFTVTIKPTTATSCLTGKTTATVRVVDRSLSNATYNTACAELKAEEYTGSQITKDIAKLTDAKTGLQLKDGNSDLVYGTHYTISFGENVNVKDGGKIIITGIGAYEGSVKEIPFTINPIKVTNKDLSASSYILQDAEVKKAEEYKDAFNLVVKGKNITLVEGTDYTVTYDFNSKNEVGEEVTATVTLKNGNFSTTGPLTKSVELFAPVICDENIQLKKDTYEYTAAPIVPEFDVVVGGKTLVKDEDYVILNTQDVTEVGEAKVVITGKGKYSNKVNAEAKFNIVATSAENVKVTLEDTSVIYDGTSKKVDVEKATLGQNADVTKQFDVTYGENINAGKGTVILTPKKNNKNFTGTKTVEFTITQAELSGSLKLYNDKHLVANATNNDVFDYDGTAHTYAKEVFTKANSVTTPVTTDDYEIIYVDNVYGKKYSDNRQYGVVLVVAKGNYKNTRYSLLDAVTNGVYTDAKGNKIKNVVAAKYFAINPTEVHKNNITVSNGQYREGYKVKPVVNVVVNGKTLVEGEDYKLSFNANDDLTKVTATKSLIVTVVPMNGYKAAGSESLTFNWGIDKFDLANAELIVTGTDAEPNVKVMNGNVAVDTAEYDLTVADGKVTVSAKVDSKNYTGSQSVDIKQALVKPEAPMISNVKVVGNKATVVLSEESEGAMGYDYVISTDRDCINNKAYDAVNKNQIKTETTFDYVGQGTYYAYCHAWTRDENGKKVFSDWSNAYPFAVSAITPSQPTITSVKVDGSTVTVTYTEAENAEGYDVVLGTSSKKVNGEVRPVNYGKLVKKNQKTTTVTFKNVEEGTYYVGLHAFNRTSEDGKKVFSQWSNVKKATVK